MKHKSAFHISLAAFFLLTILYGATHLSALTSLPVFADEAIYIRWAQLIMDDAGQYLFFALNDGKTPLFIWLLVPFQYLFADQLFAGRIVSVLVGFIQLWVIGAITKELGGTKKTIWLSILLTTILPFWYFHHRMALMDGFLTLNISIALWSLLKLTHQPLSSKSWLQVLWNKDSAKWMGLTGLAIGMALWTKLPAVLILLTFPFYSLLPNKIKLKQRLWLLSKILVSILIGLLFFLLLKLHPAFGQLFSRGGDFLYPFSDVFFKGVWMTTLRNTPTYIGYFVSYLSLAVILLNVYGLFSPRYQKQQWLLFISAMSIIGPIALLGKVVYPRYFLPAIIFLTVSAVLSLQEITHRYIYQQSNLATKMIGTLVVMTLLSQMVAVSSAFIMAQLTTPDSTPFVSADQTQYLDEWSSGHGIPETVQLIQQLSQDHSVAVATEGYFGTLPDGLLMYFHNQNVDHISIEGIGQPVSQIPHSFISQTQSFQQILLVVNSHRLNLTLSPDKKLLEVCRPHNSPCLQVWDITDFVRKN